MLFSSMIFLWLFLPCVLILNLILPRGAANWFLIDRMFEGSKSKFFAAFLSGQSLSKEELKELKQVLRQAGQEEA